MTLHLVSPAPFAVAPSPQALAIAWTRSREAEARQFMETAPTARLRDLWRVTAANLAGNAREMEGS